MSNLASEYGLNPGEETPASVALLSDRRPKVRLPGDGYLLSECAREMAKVLKPKDIFRRGGMVVTINERRDGLAQITPDTFRSWIEDFLVCFKIRKLSGADQVVEFKRTITQSDAAGILASPQFQEELNELERFNPIRVPVMTRDGYVELLHEGYHAELKSFTLDPLPIVSGMPIDHAKSIIDDLLSEFVFSDAGRSKAVALAAMLTVFGRGLLPPKSLRPCFIFLANAEGAGKTLLVKVATVPVLGYAPVGTAPKDEDEMRKVLLTATIEGRPVVFLDNFKRHVASESLEGFLTCSDYEGRILGQSKSFRGENNAVVFITGNGCTVSPDMRRRSLFCELFLEAERAEDRTFQNNLEVPTLLERRSEILTALWALIQDWNNMMRPKPSRGNSSFPDWSDIIGGIVEHCGYGCPLEPAHIESAADADGDDMRELVAILADGAVLKVVDFDEIISTCRSAGLFERIIQPETELDSKSKCALGKLLRRYDRRVVGKCRFSLEGKGHGRRFKVERVKP